MHAAAMLAIPAAFGTLKTRSGAAWALPTAHVGALARSAQLGCRRSLPAALPQRRAAPPRASAGGEEPAPPSEQPPAADKPAAAAAGDGGDGSSLISSVGLFLLWAGLAGYAFLLSPNQTPFRDGYFLEKLVGLGAEDGVPINTIVQQLFLIMGVWPLVYTALLIPSGKSGNGVPAWPFITLSYAFGEEEAPWAGQGTRCSESSACGCTLAPRAQTHPPAFSAAQVPLACCPSWRCGSPPKSLPRCLPPPRTCRGWAT